MGACELSVEPVCASPRVFVVVDRNEGTDNAVSCGVVERAVEPLLSLCSSSPATDRGPDESGAKIGAQQQLGSDSGDGVVASGIEGGIMTNGCSVSLKGAKVDEASVEAGDFECAGGRGAVACDGLDEKLDEMVVPLLGLDLSSQAPRSELDHSSEEGSCNVDHSCVTIEVSDGTAGDFCQGTTCNVTECVPIIERHDVKCGPSDNDPESGNASIVNYRLNRICLDEGLCNSGMNLCLTNLTFEGEGTLGIQKVAAGPSDSAGLQMEGANMDCDTPIGRNHVDAVCLGTMDNNSSKVLLSQGIDTLARSSCVGVPNFSHVAEGVNQIGEAQDNNDGINGDKVKCADTCSLPLRRSSRSKKTVQQVQKGKRATRYTMKALKDSLPQPIDLLPEVIRKKRSSYSRSMRSSGWGTSENLSKHFQFSNVVAVSQVTDKRSRKKKADERSRKKDVLKVVETSASAEEKQEISSHPFRLRITFGKKEEQGKGDIIPLPLFDLPGLQPDSDIKPLSFCSNVESVGGNVTDSSLPKEIPRLMQCSKAALNVQFTASNKDVCSDQGTHSYFDSSCVDEEKMDGCAGKFSDPGTSPDSEVVDQFFDSMIGKKALPPLHNSVDKRSHGNASLRSHRFPSKKSMKKRNNKDKLYETVILALECQHSVDKAKMLKKDGELQKPSDECCSGDTINTDCENRAREDFDSMDYCADINPYSGVIIGLKAASGNSYKALPRAATQRNKNAKGSNTKRKSRNKYKSTDKLSFQQGASSQQNSEKKLTSKHKMREPGISHELGTDVAFTGNLEMVDASKTEFNEEVALENTSCLDLIPGGTVEQTLVARVAWVCCDDCLKWRCIPAVLADDIEATNCRWICKDNQDKAFADCSIPQERSNADINAELQISDEEDARDGQLGSKGSGLKQVLALQPSTWMLIKSNLFLHRSRKFQTMDEIMVCHCKPPADGSLGCGNRCLNRMLSIECVQGTCPCGDLCSNQQFQRHQYAKLSWFRCGKKGYGLQVLEEISEGQFLIEYVGEVLDLQAYEARQKEYASKGHKHYYFMTLNGNEVIDASAKGNVGRFLNHSCDPNCHTEKWVVNGEICVGLFASRSIKKGEEVTFDYNYVRVFGAAAKKCHCGSHKCRGYIGGDPLNAETIVQGDSDEEFPEPVAINENGEIEHSLGELMAKASSQDFEQFVNGKKSSKESSENIAVAEENVNQIGSSIDDCGPVHSFLGKDSINEISESTDSSSGIPHENWRCKPISSMKCHISSTEHTIGTPPSSSKSDVMHIENPTQKSLSGSVDSSIRVSEVDSECGLQIRACPRMKVSRPSKSVKNRKSSCISTTVGKVLLTAQRPKVFSCKPKKALEDSANVQPEDVEKNLNELLDADGGICKKKDSSKGYLKLLLLTAASGDSGNGGAIQSNRILSMILDAMLKTKSRGVLLDIINKNGLQMLHNMMKLYRRDFKKIPILRKLLKVLEFLAEKELLTAHHINVDSLHPGVESFRESILSFTEHDDFQVHQIARSFRDRWIPHARIFHRLENRRGEFRRVSNSNRHLGSYHHWPDQGAMAVEHLTCSDQSGSMSNLADAISEEASPPLLSDDQTMVNRPRKRKSRWDQPSSPEKVDNSRGKRTPIHEANKGESNCSGDQNIARHRAEDMMHNLDNEAPPGFSYLHDSIDDTPPGFSSVLCPLSLGIPQTRFNPHLPVAYGIPFSVIQKFGIAQCGTVDTWAIAPAMPFQPFPPLPPYPCNRRPSPDQGEVRQGYYCDASDRGLPCASGAGQNTVGANQDKLHHENSTRNFIGKRCNWQRNWNGSKKRPPRARCYRQKNWNPKRRPPRAQNIDGWGFRGNYPPDPRNGSSDISMEIVNEPSGEGVAGVNHSAEYAGNSW